MNQFILLSFAFMGVAFYELSGGGDFVPRKAELIAAAREAEAAQQAERAQRVAARTQPEAPRTATPALPVRQDAAVVQAALRTDAPAPEPKPQVAAALPVAAVATDTPPAITLVSLEQSGELFARPLNQLAEQGPAPTEPGVVLQTRPADMRSVTGTRVNMRSGPGTDFDVLASLTQGAQVEILADEGIGWVKLRTEDGQVGWMADYLLSAPAG